MAFSFHKPIDDIFACVLDLRRTIAGSNVKRERNPHCAAGLQAAADRLAEKVLTTDDSEGFLHLYNINLALRAIVYDLQDTRAISEACAQAILCKSFELERRYLMVSGGTWSASAAG